MSAIDLHTHSNASDGALTPEELVERACGRGLKFMALTDHDTTAGVAAAQQAAAGRLTLIPGIELSTTWEELQIHVAGLFIDCSCARLQELISAQRVRRIERAEQIGLKLESLGFKDARARTRLRAGEGAVITRGNYARFIFEEGKARSVDEAFSTYLKRGRRAYVKTQWTEIPAAVEIIHAAGGVAVLAHPRRYLMSNGRLRKLIAFFKKCGGEAMEVASSQQRPCDRAFLADLCVQYDLLASAGSDFHNPGGWRELGLNLELPEKVTPVWKAAAAQGHGFECR